MRKRVLHLKHAAKAVGNDGKHILSCIVSMICGLEFQQMPVDFVPRGRIFMRHCNRRGIVLALQIILNMQLCTSHQCHVRVWANLEQVVPHQDQTATTKGHSLRVTHQLDENNGTSYLHWHYHPLSTTL